MTRLERAACEVHPLTVEAQAVDGPQWWAFRVTGKGTTTDWYPTVNEAAEALLVMARGYVVDRRKGERRNR